MIIIPLPKQKNCEQLENTHLEKKNYFTAINKEEFFQLKYVFCCNSRVKWSILWEYDMMIIIVSNYYSIMFFDNNIYFASLQGVGSHLIYKVYNLITDQIWPKNPVDKWNVATFVIRFVQLKYLKVQFFN